MHSCLLYIVLITTCLLCYFETLNGDFVFDDTVAIVKNPDVVNVAKRSILRIFSNDFWGYNLTDPTSHKSYRPLTTLMFRLEYGYLKFSSLQMKSINLLLHTLNSCLCFMAFTELSQGNKKLSIFGSILFAIHPIHTEVVCGIVNRAELMFGLCLLMTICLLVKNKENWFNGSLSIISVGVISCLGLLFKESAITILPICICLDIIQRTGRYQKIRISSLLQNIQIKKTIVFSLYLILLLTCRLYIQDFQQPKFKPMDNPIAENEDFLTRLLSQNLLYVINCWIMLCPEWLCFDWALGCIDLITTVFDYRCLSILIMYFAIVSLFKNGSRLVISAFAIICISFLPASGLIKVGFVIAERTLYVPSIGFCLLIANGFCILQENFEKSKILQKFSTILNISASVFICILILRTRQRSTEWMSETALYVSGLAVCPNNAKIHFNVARLATDSKEKIIAFNHYHKAILLYPEYESALMNLGNLYRDIGDYETAETYLKKSLRALEEFPTAWMNLGIVQAHRHKFDEALKSYEKALMYKKRYPICLYNMGNLFLEQKNYDLAIKYWQESILLEPKQPKAWANILALLDNRGLYEDALRMSEKALIALKDDPTINFVRANVYGKLKNYIDAEQIYLKLIKNYPENSLYHTNLGVLYHRWNKSDLAIKHYSIALTINPDLKSVKENLKKLYEKN